jgi:hypothetical protein
MDGLGNMKPATAIAACIFALIIMGGAVWIVAMIAKALTGRSIDLGAFKLGADGKPEKTTDGKLVRASSALAEEEIQRIASTMATQINAHECRYHDMIVAATAVIEPGMTTTIALAERAMKDGANGRIEENHPKCKETLAEFQKVKNERAMA